MFAPETTETVGLRRCDASNAEPLERDTLAGVTSIWDARIPWISTILDLGSGGLWALRSHITSRTPGSIN